MHHRASHEMVGTASAMLQRPDQPMVELPCGCRLFPYRMRVYEGCREDHGLTLPTCCTIACDDREGCHLRPPAEVG